MSQGSVHQVNLLEFLGFLLRWWRFLLSAVLAVSVCVAIISFVLKPKYRSTAVIRSQETSAPSIGTLITSKLGMLGGLSNFAPALAEVPENAYVAILKSRWMSDAVIDAFDLRSVYKMKDAPREYVVKALQAHTDFQLNDITMNVVVYVDDESPKRAKEMADFYVDRLDKRNQELRATRARMERDFIEQRLTVEQAKLTAFEDSLYHYQVTTGVLNLGEQLRATVDAASSLQAEQLATQIELDMKTQVLGPYNPESNLLRIKLASIDSTIKGLVHAKAKNKDDDFLIHGADTPLHGITTMRFSRNIEIQQTLVAYLLQQFEQAKIDEMRNTPTVMRVDPPVEADIRVWPKRGFMVLVSALGTFVFAIVGAMLYEFFSKAAQDPSHPHHERVVYLQRNLRRSR